MPEADAAGHWQEFSFLIDGQRFDHRPDRPACPPRAVEEWTVTNLHVHNHVFHIHTNRFR